MAWPGCRAAHSWGSGMLDVKARRGAVRDHAAPPRHAARRAALPLQPHLGGGVQQQGASPTRLGSQAGQARSLRLGSVRLQAAGAATERAAVVAAAGVADTPSARRGCKLGRFVPAQRNLHGRSGRGRRRQAHRLVGRGAERPSAGGWAHGMRRLSTPSLRAKNAGCSKGHRHGARRGRRHPSRAGRQALAGPRQACARLLPAARRAAARPAGRRRAGAWRAAGRRRPCLHQLRVHEQ